MFKMLPETGIRGFAAGLPAAVGPRPGAVCRNRDIFLTKNDFVSPGK